MYKKNKKSSIDILDICNACSTTDCTGLIPSGHNTDEKAEHYNDIVNYEPIVNDEVKN